MAKYECVLCGYVYDPIRGDLATVSVPARNSKICRKSGCVRIAAPVKKIFPQLTNPSLCMKAC